MQNVFMLKYTLELRSINDMHITSSTTQGSLTICNFTRSIFTKM